MSYHMIYPGECPMYTWEECVFCWSWMERLDTSVRSLSLKYSSVYYSLICFLSEWSIHGWKWLLKCPIIIALLSIFAFGSVKSCLIYLGDPILGVYIFINCSIRLMDWPLYPYIPSLSIVTAFYLKSILLI